MLLLVVLLLLCLIAWPLVAFVAHVAAGHLILIAVVILVVLLFSRGRTRV